MSEGTSRVGIMRPRLLNGPRMFLRKPIGRYFTALSATVFCTAVAFPFYPKFNVTNIAMLYLLGTTLVALRLV
jgi:K+-sensing histidine kinase KdpD